MSAVLWLAGGVTHFPWPPPSEGAPMGRGRQAQTEVEQQVQPLNVSGVRERVGSSRTRGVCSGLLLAGKIDGLGGGLPGIKR